MGRPPGTARPSALVASATISLSLLAGAAPAQQPPDGIAFSMAGEHRQKLTATLTGDAGPTPIRLSLTYRQVSTSKPPSLDKACAPTMAQNSDTRLVNAVPASGSYRIRRSVELPLGVFAVCLYEAFDGSSDPAAAQLIQTTVAGELGPVTHGGAPAPARTAITVRVVGAGAHAVFKGHTTVSTGRVIIQRLVGGRYRTVARTRVRHGTYSVRVAVRHGQRYRAVLAATRTYRSSKTNLVRIQ